MPGAKVIHRGKNLFCYVAHICNLVQEFNGLVSKRVDRKDQPFLLLITEVMLLAF
jgi:hypothetical protein